MTNETRQPKQFDSYEIAPVRKSQEHDCYEICTPAEAELWTLYGHIPGEGVEAICDLKTKADCEAMLYRLTGHGDYLLNTCIEAEASRRTIASVTSIQPAIATITGEISKIDTESLQQLLANLDQELRSRIDSDFLFIQWHIDDVREVRADLTADQCREVLRSLQKQHNAEIGINWDVIAITAKDLYPVQEDSSSKIAELNDLCRKAMGIAGRLIQTEGINALPPEEQSAIREKVENFSDFPEDNDPYGERDFGAFDHNGQKIFWKIDYYAPDLMHGSENPADPAQTVRVLTIMLASEY